MIEFKHLRRTISLRRTPWSTVGYEVVKRGKSSATLKVYFDVLFDRETESTRYFQFIDVHEGPSSRGALRCEFCGVMVDQLYMSAGTEVFGCVPCFTALDSDELKTYRRTLKLLESRQRNVA